MPRSADLPAWVHGSAARPSIPYAEHGSHHLATHTRENQESPRPFVWTGNLDPVIAAIQRGKHVIDSGMSAKRIRQSMDGGATWGTRATSVPIEPGGVFRSTILKE
jgi:hypothetical protein